MVNQKKDWYIRTSEVPFNGKKISHSELRVATLDEANVALLEAAQRVAILNGNTRRLSTYYVEPLFHACGCGDSD